ncbi:hypothetical protein AB0I94_35080 [Streptomyces sp. NPDC050147]|uniref:hypothetical protein n=1 Tax=Streptomyces sp. NPDC050147 TaxID=3155513 RepID=UPI003442A401
MAEPTTDRDRWAVRRLRAAGKSRNAIARELGRGAASVSKIAAERGLTFTGRPRCRHRSFGIVVNQYGATLGTRPSVSHRADAWEARAPVER